MLYPKTAVNTISSSRKGGKSNRNFPITNLNIYT